MCKVRLKRTCACHLLGVLNDESIGRSVTTIVQDREDMDGHGRYFSRLRMKPFTCRLCQSHGGLIGSPSKALRPRTKMANIAHP